MTSKTSMANIWRFPFHAWDLCWTPHIRTGSMSSEIRALQNFVLSFVSSEQNEPACYVITPFNDWHGYTDRGLTPPGPGSQVAKLLSNMLDF